MTEEYMIEQTEVTSLNDTDILLTTVNVSTVPLSRKITWSSIKTLVGSSLGAIINSLTGKTTPVDNDYFVIGDSAATNASKKLTWANVKATLKTYFDTLYPPNNGWISVSDTWTRTGNYTFTVSGDVTTTYRKATKVRYKDGGSYEYGVIASSSYSAPNTTITLIANSDYAMAAATITDKYISYAENPEGFPAYFSYATTPTNFTVGNGTLVARWTAALGRMHVHLEFVLGSTSSVGSTPSFSLPVASSGYSSQFFTSVGVGMYFDNAGTSYAGQLALNGSGDVSSAYLVALVTSGSYASQTDLSATKPFTWGTGDIMQAELSYQW